MSIFLTDSLECLSERDPGDEVMLSSQLKEFGGGLSPSALLLCAAARRQVAPLWIVVRDEPQRPSNVDWLMVLKQAELAKTAATVWNANRPINLVCPVPMRRPTLNAPMTLDFGGAQRNENLVLWADPTVVLLPESEWPLLKKMYSGLCWPLVGLTTAEMLEAVDAAKRAAAASQLPLVILPYKRLELPAAVLEEVAAMRVLQFPRSVRPYSVRGEVLPWQEHELVTNLFSLPLKGSVAQH